MTRKSSGRAIVQYAAGRSYTQPLISSNIIHLSNVLESDTISTSHGGSFMSGKHSNLDTLSEAVGQQFPLCLWEVRGEHNTRKQSDNSLHGKAERVLYSSERGGFVNSNITVISPSIYLQITVKTGITCGKCDCLSYTSTRPNMQCFNNV